MARLGTLTAVRASLFITCFNDTLFPETGRAVVALLERLGVEVDFPLEQTCCGQMHFNTGYAARDGPARAALRAGVRRQRGGRLPLGVVRRHGARRLPARGRAGRRRGPCSARSRALIPRVFELTELLVDRLGVEDVGAVFPHRVTYHPTCHSLRMLHVGDRPLRLLRAVKGIDLLELPEADECCGFGGTFSVKNADTSIAMLDRQGPRDPRHRRRGVRQRRQLLPDAHRRRALAPARGRAHDAHRRDPRPDRWDRRRQRRRR